MAEYNTNQSLTMDFSKEVQNLNKQKGLHTNQQRSRNIFEQLLGQRLSLKMDRTKRSTHLSQLFPFVTPAHRLLA
jgi:hypothetical protein